MIKSKSYNFKHKHYLHIHIYILNIYKTDVFNDDCPWTIYERGWQQIIHGNIIICFDLLIYRVVAKFSVISEVLKFSLWKIDTSPRNAKLRDSKDLQVRVIIWLPRSQIKTCFMTCFKLSILKLKFIPFLQ